MVAILGLGAISGCSRAMKLTPNDADVVLSRQLLDAPNPARPGAFPVLRLYYGSGKDKRRSEFRDSVTTETESIDASKLISLGQQAKDRNSYWGFSPKDFPINGRVWWLRPVGRRDARQGGVLRAGQSPGDSDHR